MRKAVLQQNIHAKVLGVVHFAIIAANNVVMHMVDVEELDGKRVNVSIKQLNKTMFLSLMSLHLVALVVLETQNNVMLIARRFQVIKEAIVKI